MDEEIEDGTTGHVIIEKRVLWYTKETRRLYISDVPPNEGKISFIRRTKSTGVGLGADKSNRVSMQHSNL